MTYNLSYEGYETIQKLEAPDVKRLVTMNDEEKSITFDNVGELLSELNDAIPHYGMTKGFEDVTPYGRKLYALYDEIYYYDE